MHKRFNVRDMEVGLVQILVCNAGSTSLKFKLIRFPEEQSICSCTIERIGTPGKGIYRFNSSEKAIDERREAINVQNYEAGIEIFIEALKEHEICDPKDIACIGYKTVLAQGYRGIHELTDHVMEAMDAFLPAAPIHSKAYIECIRAMKRSFPDILMMGIFESAFHETIPEYARIYAIPWEWYKEFGIMRLGYHGASHGYIAGRLCELIGGQFRAVSLHLGGSASACAIQDGQSVANSFGFTPQTGLPHACRAGDFDVFALPYLLEKEGSVEHVLYRLSHDGGLLGISGVSEDMRDIEQAARTGNERAELAIEHYCCEIVKTIGAYYACLGGLDAIVFTAGIGENSKEVRRRVCDRIAHMGVELDEEKNNTASGEAEISGAHSKVKLYVLPTNEELELARQLYICMEKGVSNSAWIRRQA